MKRDTPQNVWLYKRGGLSHASAGLHEEAARWLAQGIRLGLQAGDPEGLVGQMSAERTSTAVG